MAEYIEREAVLALIQDNRVVVAEPTAELEFIRQDVMNIPAADVNPVVHGEWIWYETALYDDVFGYAIKCSACKEVFTETDVSQKPMEYSFCPNCGADMREAE